MPPNFRGMQFLGFRPLKFDNSFAWNRWLLFTLAVIPFYFFNVFLLVPKLLLPRKYGQYALSVILSISVIVVIIYAFSQLLMNPLDGVGRTLGSILPMLMLLGIGTSFEMILNWEKQRRKQETIEKEKMEAELAFLKSQIDPHFLFNSLNNIYSLAELQSENTGQSILLLANLMRYMLYETNSGKIQLTKEVQHIEDYIALQKLRIHLNEDVDIDFRQQGDLAGIYIEPLLLIPFIENAFKHGISYNQRSFIQLELSVENNNMILKILNSKRKSAQKNENAISHSGIGIANTKRRLELLYPNQHTLDITDDNEYYLTFLQLDLKPITNTPA